jgi:Toprim domain
MQAHVRRHLADCAKGCEHIVLWLDCDREGENICFEVLECALPAMRPARPHSHVWRARFSAITAPEISSAMASLGEPNRDEALAVDARQELDLKVRLGSACLCDEGFRIAHGGGAATSHPQKRASWPWQHALRWLTGSKAPVAGRRNA